MFSKAKSLIGIGSKPKSLHSLENLKYLDLNKLYFNLMIHYLILKGIYLEF